MRSIWFRKHGQGLWTMNEKRRKELQLIMSRPEGCEQTGRLRNSEFAQLRKYIRCKKVQHCKNHEALNKNPGSGSSGCISAKSCLSAVATNTCTASASAEHLVPRLRPGPLDHMCEGVMQNSYSQQAVPSGTAKVQAWPEAVLSSSAEAMVVSSVRRPASRCRGSWRPPTGAGCTFGKPELAAGGNCSELENLQLDWPEAALPRCAGVMVVPSLRRSASRCRGTLRPPAYAQLLLHTSVKDSAKAVKPDVCRCAALKKNIFFTTSRPLPSALTGAWSPWAEGVVVRRETDEISVAVLATALTPPAVSW